MIDGHDLTRESWIFCVQLSTAWDVSRLVSRLLRPASTPIEERLKVLSTCVLRAARCVPWRSVLGFILSVFSFQGHRAGGSAPDWFYQREGRITMTENNHSSTAPRVLVIGDIGQHTYHVGDEAMTIASAQALAEGGTAVTP